jgi:ribosomal protein S18 acetylase RimI-like enzyme
MLIRRLAPDDVHDYRALRLAGIAEAPSSFWASHAEEEAVPLELMRQRLEQTPYQAIFGAYDGAQLVATAGFKREHIAKIDHRGNIWGVYVAPAARGTGLSRKLMEALIAHARTIPGLIQITLCVRTSNDVAKALYCRLGFVITGTDLRSIHTEGVFHDEHRMLLHLDAT